MNVVVSIEGLKAGTQITAGDITLPEGSTLSGLDPDALIINITAAATAEQVEAELAEAEAELGIEPTLAEDDTDAAQAEGSEESSEDSDNA